MDLKSLVDQLVNDPAAQDPHDRAIIQRLVAAFETLLESRGIEPTPFVLLRLHDVITQYRLARRIEAAVFAEGVVQNKQPNEDDTPKSETNAAKRRSTAKDTGLHPALDALTKAWDRVRKALQDLESACAVPKTGKIPSLADIATPLLEETDGIMEYAIEVEENRQRELERLTEENIRLKAQQENKP